MPQTLFGLIRRVSGHHQIWLALLSILVFAVETVPIDIQRRLVNAAVKGGDVHAVWMFAALLAGLSLTHGLLKLGLNVYRGWAGETAVRWLRLEIAKQPPRDTPAPSADKPDGVEIAMVIAEAEPIGGFIGLSVSEPLLQGGVMVAVFGYLVYLNPLMAVIGLFVFLPQLVLVPLMQGAINRRVGIRIWTLRKISIALVQAAERDGAHLTAQTRRVDRIFQLNMGIYEFKFTLNFLMNFLTALGTAAILGIGGSYVIDGQTEIGTVVAFVSGLAKIATPWGDLVNWFRDFRVTQERYRLIVHALAR